MLVSIKINMQINQQFNMFEPRQNWKPYALKIVMYVRKIRRQQQQQRTTITKNLNLHIKCIHNRHEDMKELVAPPKF